MRMRKTKTIRISTPITNPIATAMLSVVEEAPAELSISNKKKKKNMLAREKYDVNSEIGTWLRSGHGIGYVGPLGRGWIYARRWLSLGERWWVGSGS